MFALIRCIDRDIELLGSFENKELAYDAMEKDLSKMMGMDRVPENWDNTEYERGDDFDISTDGAWLNKSGDHDWKIVSL